ncbi:sigma-70 family RNA polymerase sigma factor [Luteolibacter sp. SL250]|uniref:sigma-70 family RNA polymerase sigma factor n=1 Tax=Luteolibacter sp. SL250 TaxID=2995170 RepID=UPI002271D9C1|nr:sigma-70 family RNA polymerase sigma factor [Luteolibacter sp. SL250]WAC19505.1 sigma-70 family RNA polymerase sigma factor [Luteolibacter sp. SL250]
MSGESNDEAFVALLIANQNRIFRFLMTLVPRREDAEDLFQQTSITLWRSRAKYDPAAGDFTSWACAIAHNHVRNFRRKESTRRNILSGEIERMLIETRAVHSSLMDEWHRALGLCMQRLTPHQRTIVEDCYGGDGKIKDAAMDRGRTPNALYKILRGIRSLLHDCIRKSVTGGNI